MRGTNAGRLLSEFLVIVIGVLVALGVDQWRESRADRVSEAQYVGRLVSDLLSDSAETERSITVGLRKTAALTEVMDALMDGAAVRRNPSLAWPDMGFTYSLPPLQTTTFDELKGAGGLSLIREDELRYQVGDYYREVLHHFDRLDGRRTEIAWTVAGLWPSIAWGGATTSGLSASATDSAFYAAPDVEYRFQKLMGPEYRTLLNQERIYANSMVEISRQMLALTIELLSGLRAYQASLG